MIKLILATTSPHRIKAFEMLGIPFEAEASDVDEGFPDRPKDAILLVAKLARMKAESVAKRHSEECFVIGFDSVGCFNGKILEKPKDERELISRLTAMSGKEYQFLTGIFIIKISPGNIIDFQNIVVNTNVKLRNITYKEIKKYLEQDPNYKTYASGFDPLNTYGSTFIKEIHGSYNNPLRGIPLETIMEMLNKMGFEI